MEGLRDRDYRGYTLKEDRVIIEQIKDNPGNISRAIEKASKELNRSRFGIESYWYKKLSKRVTVYSLNVEGREKVINRKRF